MNQYHKIQTVFKRDPDNKFRTLLEGEYALPEFEYLSGNKWVFTEKVDGTNIRVMFDGEQISFGGKTNRAQIPPFLLERLHSLFDPTLGRFAKQFPDGATCLYGEGYGAKIQKGGGNYRQDQSFVLFDVKIGEWWLRRFDVESIAQDLKLNTVPVIGEGTLPEMVELTREGFQSTWGNFPAEGIVARPATELKTRLGNRIITKIKCKDFPK
jgi:ATP-dependent RNA circularization protein (DNA/RNA ligase family)